jgi:serine/threonine protein kinase
MPQDQHLSALRPGARLQSYTIGAILGAGGFGITYKAREDITNREVAIKEYLPTALAMRDHDRNTVRPLSEGAARDFNWGLERFRQEAKLLIEFHHPNIVPVLAYTEANGTGYLVMEFQQGTSLAELLRSTSTLSEGQVLQFMGPLLDGVEEVHRRNVVHRDIKPDNIFIRNDGTPVLLDFGAARQALCEGLASHTAVLTEGFAPFEQYSRKGNQGPWTDIYALGAVMYQCLTGKPPVEAPRRATAKLRGVADPMAQEFAALRASVSPDLAFAIESAMRVVEEGRPQTVAQFRALIASTTPGPRPVSGAAEPPASAATLIPDLARSAGFHQPPRNAAKRRSRLRDVCVAAVGAVSIVVAGAAAHLGDQSNLAIREPERARATTAAEEARITSEAQREAQRQAELARAQEESERRIAEEARRAEEAEREERKNKTLAEYQRQQLDLFETERQHVLYARRLAEAERKKSADASAPPSQPAELRPPANDGRAEPFRILRLW